MNNPNVPLQPSHEDALMASDPATIVSPVESYRNSKWQRILVGTGMLAAAGAVCYGIASGEFDDDRAEYSVPFTPTAQEAVNSIDSVLIEIGKISLPVSIAAIGAVKLGANRYPQLRAADRESSQELVDDGSRKQSRSRKVLATVAAGTLPAVATGAVGLATFTEAISTEVGSGPSRPIEKIFEDVAPEGVTLITGYDGAMPMVQSSVSRELVNGILVEANNAGIEAVVMAQNLGQLTYEGVDRSNLVLGFQQSPTSELYWDPETGCDTAVPVAVDKAADIPVGSHVTLNGTPAEVVDTIEGTSAINRIGLVMDREALATCLAKNPTSPDHAVLLGASLDEAESLLERVNKNGEASAVITPERYIENSEKFWEANVKPITNVLALVSGAMAVVSMAGIMSSRLLRNRRELAAKMAAGVSDTYIRGTELLRAAKDGVVASIAGTTIAAAVTPMANALASGFHAGVGIREVAVGFAVGTVGSVGGAFARLIRLRKTINPNENTRV